MIKRKYPTYYIEEEANSSEVINEIGVGLFNIIGIGVFCWALLEISRSI